jgi:protease-4
MSSTRASEGALTVPEGTSGAPPHRWRWYSVLILVGIIVGLSFLLAFLFDGLPEEMGVTIVRIDGTIVSGNAFGGGLSGSEAVGREIRRAADDPMVEAIVLRINSGGGTPAGAQEIVRDIAFARKKKPVISSMGDIGTSAAYYIAAATDRIYANPDTLTAGVGTIWTFYDRSDLMERRGVKVDPVKSGELKDFGADYRNLTGEERDYAQQIVNESAAYLINEITTYRHITPDMIEDARVVRGQEALKLGLIDELGNLNDAIMGAKRLAG